MAAVTSEFIVYPKGLPLRGPSSESRKCALCQLKPSEASNWRMELDAYKAGKRNWPRQVWLCDACARREGWIE